MSVDFQLNGLVALTTDVCTANGRLYPKAVMEQAAEAYKRKAARPVYMSGTDGYDLRNVIGEITETRVEHGQVKCSMKVFDAKLAKQLLDGDIAIRPCGIGQIDGSVVSDYSIEHFIVTDRPA